MNIQAIELIISTIAPVFVLICLGAVLKGTGFITDELSKGLNRLVYWVGLPVFLFYRVAANEKSFGDVLPLYYVLLIGIAAAVVVAYLVALLLKLDKPSIAAFIHCAFRGNFVFVGLPLIIFCFASDGAAKASRIEDMTILILSLMIPTFNVLAVFVLVLFAGKIDISFPVRVVIKMLHNPLIIAVLLGIGYSKLFSGIPVSIERSCLITGQMTLPLALLSIGANIILASLIKVALCPVVGFFVMKYLIHLPEEQQMIAMLLLACPTAVSSYVLTEQLGGNKHLTAAGIVVSTVLCVFSISGAMYVMR
jgi:predicted permease